MQSHTTPASSSTTTEENKPQEGMLSKLIVTLDGEKIVLHSHEVVKLVQEITQEYISELKEPFVLPDYDSLEEAIQEDFNAFSNAVLSVYEEEYQFKEGILEKYLEESKSPYTWIFRVKAWSSMLDAIKKCKLKLDGESFLEKNDVYPFLPIPPQIKDINNISKWMQLANSLSNAENAVQGWWLLIAGRVIFVKNTPEEKNTHLYVSDHGNLDSVIQQTYDCTMQHLLKKPGETVAMFKFYRSYSREIPQVMLKSELPKSLKPNTYYLIGKTPFASDSVSLVFVDEDKKQMECKPNNFAGLMEILNKLPKETAFEKLDAATIHAITTVIQKITTARNYLSDNERNNIKECFINKLTDDNIHDRHYLQLLLVSFGYPESYRERILHDGTFHCPTNVGMESRGRRLFANRPAKLRTNDPRYTEYEDIFNTTLEQIRYFAKLNEQHVRNLFERNLSVFFTRLTDIMTKEDAQIFEACYLQSHMKKIVSLGDHRVIFRTADSYGKRDNGDSYREFSAAFEKYLQSKDALSSSQLAKKMRDVLRGEKLENNKIAFLVNLVGAWFVAESARNPTTVFVSLLLLDLIESNIPLMRNGVNLYEWRYVFLHEKEGKEDKIKDLYGNEIKSEDKITDPIIFFRGSHPMVHKYSVAHSKTKLSNGTKLSPVRQKEGSLTLHWLSQRMKTQYPDMNLECISAEQEPLISSPSYDELKDVNVEKLSKNKSKNKKLSAKWKLVTQIVKPLLKQRLTTLDNLLTPLPEPVVKQKEDVSSLQGIAQQLSLGFIDHSSSKQQTKFDFAVYLKEWGKLSFDKAISGSLADQAASEQLSADLKKQAKKYGFDCHDVKPDGLCLLYAIEDQLRRLHESNNLIPVFTYQELHQKLVAHVLENTSHYANFYAIDCHDLADQALDYQKKWASDIGDLAAVALSRILNMTIVVISSSEQAQQKITKQQGSVATLYLGYEEGHHYQSLVRDKNATPERSIQQLIDQTNVDEGVEIVEEKKSASKLTC